MYMYHIRWRTLVGTLLLVLFFVPLQAQQVWTVKKVPNTRLRSNAIHVSNPDNIIAEETEQRINRLLDTVRQSADVFVVVLHSIGESTIEKFSDELFNYWTIGGAETNDGVLLLMVKDQRKVRIETGYGVEQSLTDADCDHIIRKKIIPYFREGNYDEGLYSGAYAIAEILIGERHAAYNAIAEPTPLQHPEDNEGISEDSSQRHVFLGLYILVNIVFFFLALAYIGKKYRTLNKTYKNNLNYAVEKMKLLRNEVAIVAFVLILLWLLYPFVLLAIRRMRNKERICSRCHGKMRKMSEKEEDEYLNSIQQTEENLRSRDYDVWVCTCGMVSIENYCGKKHSKYRVCGKCTALADKLMKNHVLQRPTYSSAGRGEKLYRCCNCGHEHIEAYSIPRLERASAVGGSWIDSGSGGGSFGGGSFGGGHSGGGGATGSW